MVGSKRGLNSCANGIRGNNNTNRNKVNFSMGNVFYFIPKLLFRILIHKQVGNNIYC
jgi:hypothetical protein